METRLMELLEYRNVLGALTTSIDGLLVASVAVENDDADLIAASTSGHDDDVYWVTDSEHGALHIATGRELRLIILAEPNTDHDSLRDLMTGHLQSIEESLSV